MFCFGSAELKTKSLLTIPANNKLSGQKSFKFLFDSLGETKASKIHSEINWPLVEYVWSISTKAKTDQIWNQQK